LIFRSGYALLEAVIGVAVCPLKEIADNRFFSGLAVDALLVMPDEGWSSSILMRLPWWGSTRKDWPR
jgi:hypothetical protein